MSEGCFSAWKGWFSCQPSPIYRALTMLEAQMAPISGVGVCAHVIRRWVYGERATSTLLQEMLYNSNVKAKLNRDWGGWVTLWRKWKVGLRQLKLNNRFAKGKVVELNPDALTSGSDGVLTSALKQFDWRQDSALSFSLLIRQTFWQSEY